MSSDEHFLRPKRCVLMFALVLAATLHGQVVTSYSGASANASWTSATGGTPVVLNFESIANSTQTIDATFTAYAATAGIVFLPMGNGTYPRVEVGQGGNGALGPNWLGNYLNYGSYTTASAIAWTFNQSIRAFGFYDVGSDDGFTVNIYSSGGLSNIGTFTTTEVTGTPLFWGFIATQDIGKVEVIPRIGNGYIGIDGLSTVAVPEPSTAALVLGLCSVALARRRRIASAR